MCSSFCVANMSSGNRRKYHKNLPHCPQLGSPQKKSHTRLYMPLLLHAWSRNASPRLLLQTLRTLVPRAHSAPAVVSSRRLICKLLHTSVQSSLLCHAFVQGAFDQLGHTVAAVLKLARVVPAQRLRDAPSGEDGKLFAHDRRGGARGMLTDTGGEAREGQVARRRHGLARGRVRRRLLR